jgi:hypothetical protein
MTQTYVHGITDTVTHEVTSGLTAGQIEAAGPALSISAVSPDRWLPGDGAVVISRDGRALRGEVADVCVCTGQVVITLA